MVEYCYDDWAISLLANVLYAKTGDEKYREDYQKYAARAFLYKELYRADAVIPAAQYQEMVGMGEQAVGAEPIAFCGGKMQTAPGWAGTRKPLAAGRGCTRVPCGSIPSGIPMTWQA